MKKTSLNGSLKRRFVLLLFVLGLILVLEVLSAASVFILRHSDLTIQKRNATEIDFESVPRDSLDGVVLGSSLAYMSVRPDVIEERTGERFYVLGLPEEKMAEAYHLFRLALSRQDLKIVAIECGMLFQERSKVQEIQDTATEAVSVAFPIIKTHDAWKAFFPHEKSKEIRERGFRIEENSNDVVPADTTGYMAPTDACAPISDYSRTILNKICRQCRKRGIQVVLFSAPSVADGSMARHNALEKLAKDLEVSYVDYNTKDIGIDWNTDTCDGGEHLNLQGAGKVSEAVASDLKQDTAGDRKTGK
ncbi:MAG: hypothetical protein SOH60_00175 [Lachnospiraceae bacterium]|jgi:hypothetical protein